MIKRRRFRAYHVRNKTETGIGIVEYRGDNKTTNWENEVIGIASIYQDRRISNRDACVNIYQYIYNDLKDDEHAFLQMYQFHPARKWRYPYRKKLSVRKIEYHRGRIYHAQLLAEDAIRRKSTIEERFNDPIKFSIVEMEKEERKYKLAEKK